MRDPSPRRMSMNKFSTKSRSIKMDTITTKLISAGLLLLFTILSGIWLSNSGKPFNSLIFSIHKLVAVGTVVFISITVYNLYKTLAPRTFVELSVITLSGLLFLALIVTGSLLSIKISLPAVILKIHQVAPLLATISSAITVYLMVSNRS
jgi:hypothetical protein